MHPQAKAKEGKQRSRGQHSRPGGLEGKERKCLGVEHGGEKYSQALGTEMEMGGSEIQDNSLRKELNSKDNPQVPVHFLLLIPSNLLWRCPLNITVRLLTYYLKGYMDQ